MWLQLKRSNMTGTYRCTVSLGLFSAVSALITLRIVLVVIVQPLLEAVDAPAKIAHQVGNLAAAPKQHQRDQRQDQNMPDAERYP